MPWLKDFTNLKQLAVPGQRSRARARLRASPAHRRFAPQGGPVPQGIFDRIFQKVNVDFEHIMFRVKMPDAGIEVKELEKQSADGDVAAQYRLGLINEIQNGGGDASVNLFSRAAKGGNPMRSSNWASC